MVDPLGAIYSMWLHNPQGSWAKMFIVYNLDLLSLVSPSTCIAITRCRSSFCVQILAVGRPAPTPIGAWSEQKLMSVYALCIQPKSHYPPLGHYVQTPMIQYTKCVFLKICVRGCKIIFLFHLVIFQVYNKIKLEKYHWLQIC